MSCERCGREAPVRRLAFHQHIGLLILFVHSRYSNTMCRICADELFRRTTIITAIAGWWGVFSVFLTPITLVINAVGWAGARSLPYPDAGAIPHGGSTETRDLRFGLSAILMCIWAFFLWGAGQIAFFVLFAPAPVVAAAVLVGVSLLDLIITPLTAINVLARAKRVAPGTPGRFRFMLIAIASLVRIVPLLAFTGLIAHGVLTNVTGAAALAPFGSPEGGPLAILDILPGYVGEAALMAIIGLVVIANGAGTVQSVAAFTTWWLIPLRTRKIIWLVVDVILVVANIVLWGAFAAVHLLDMDPSSLFVVEVIPEDKLWPAVRLAVTTLAAQRVLFRLLPIALNLAERVGFRLLAAARMLRARKSGFLTIIGALSILAVTVSTLMLTTVLSIMGGFRNDLKQKILGNNAHVVIDRERGTISDWRPILERARRNEDVTAASPYVTGEVMITSSTNLSGAILRGIDPRTIGQVTDLPRNMRHGGLRYLEDPERLLRLRTAEMQRGILAPLPSEVRDEERGEDEEEGERGSIFGDVEEAAGDDPEIERIERDIDEFLLDDESPGLSPFAAPEPEVLPGIIVGQELARTLRLHVGDEVDVVSPFGEIGPAGMIPKTRPFRVAGIFYSGMYEFDMKMAYVTLPDAQRFLETGSDIHGIEVKVEDPDQAESVARALASSVGQRGLRVRAWQEVNRNLFGALQLEKLAMFITLGIAILVASFCVVGSLTLMVQEKAREVGILKAMGATGEQIIAVFMAQGLMIGLLGAIMGLGWGYVVCFYLEQFGFALNPEVYYIDRLPVYIDGSEFALVGVAAVVVCLLATIYPALLASRLRPVDALRDA